MPVNVWVDRRGFQVIKRSLCLLALWLMVAMAGALTATQLIKSIWLHMTVLLSPSSVPPSVYGSPLLSFFFPFSRRPSFLSPHLAQFVSTFLWFCRTYQLLEWNTTSVSFPLTLLSVLSLCCPCLWWPAVLQMCPTPPAAGIVTRAKRETWKRVTKDDVLILIVLVKE